MTTELIPCTCKVVAKRNPTTLLSATLVYVDNACPHHGFAPPKADAK